MMTQNELLDKHIREHRADAVKFARRFDRQNAEDIVQDACCKAIRGKSCSKSGSYAYWFKIILLRVCCDALRARRASMCISLESLSEHHLPFAESAEDTLLRRETLARQQQAINTALASLPPMDVNILMLSMDRRYKQKVIADMNLTTVAALQMRLLRLKRKLKPMLTEML